MRGQQSRTLSYEHTAQRKSAPTVMDEPQQLAKQRQDVVSLQRLVGNRGVQSLMSQGRVSPQGNLLSLTRQAQPAIQRCGCGGACAACSPQSEEISTASTSTVQRWWGDDDDESESSDSGGSWVDSATDWVSDTATDAYETGAQALGDAVDIASDTARNIYDTASDTAGGAANWASDTASDAYDWASDTAGGVADWASDTWNEWTGEEEEPQTSDAEDSGWGDWLPEWGTDEESEESESEEAHDLVDISAECETQNSMGFGEGSARQLKLHGLTVSNYNHGKPLPEPFPSGVTVTTEKKGNDDVFSASGSFETEFASNPSVSLPSMPGGLTECQQDAVQKFISGPLTAHENDHKAAFVNNYDGTFTATVNVSGIKDTAANRKLAMTNPVNAEDQKRSKAANDASKSLDPWKETVQGLDCK